jgi:hypothetical protein
MRKTKKPKLVNNLYFVGMGNDSQLGHMNNTTRGPHQFQKYVQLNKEFQRTHQKLQLEKMV